MSLANLDGEVTPGDLLDLGLVTRDSNGRMRGGSQIAETITAGPGDPVTLANVPSGNEYVWFKTDGAGTLIDIVTGVKP